MEPPRAPSRAATDHPESLASLETPSVLVAFAASTLGVAEAAELAARAIERWGAAWSDAELTRAIMFALDGDAPRKPETLSLPAKSFATSAAWQKLQAAMPSARQVCAHGGPRRERAGIPMFTHGDGFDFGRGLVTLGPSGDDDLPTLRLAIDIRDRTDSDALLRMARSFVDDFVTRAKCIQAFVARWGTGARSTAPPTKGCAVCPANALCGEAGRRDSCALSVETAFGSDCRFSNVSIAEHSTVSRRRTESGRPCACCCVAVSRSTTSSSCSPRSSPAGTTTVTESTGCTADETPRRGEPLLLGRRCPSARH